MKCTNCGNNNASYHYRTNLNGEVTEAHLCPECAAELQPEKEFAVRRQELFGDLFRDDFFGGKSLLDGFFNRDPLETFFGRSLFGRSPFAMLGAPMIEIRFPDAGKATPEPERKPEGTEKPAIDPELSKKREMNALREQMRAAAEVEDYEKAAELRDQLRAMENEK